MFLEVIATNLEDAKMIERSGANRIELCQALEHGGYTPDYEVIRSVCSTVKLPVRVIVRHQDTDFFYHEAEFNQILADIEVIKQTAAEGIVVGILNPDYTVDTEHLRIIIKQAHPLKVTFHKAFDLIRDKKRALLTLGQLGVSTILTQGGEQPIATNLVELASLTKLNLLQIQAGGGVNWENLDQVRHVVNSIHVGTMVRINHSWSHPIDAGQLNLLVKHLKTSRK